ncbi:helix-turn-helix domain-containing protein [Sulfurivirga caldicuralii]|nr:helix-turn-helix domain-containing protein [Sulfurivirga caldicuralii]
MADYQRLTQEERYQIWALKITGKGISAIACELNIHPPSVGN